MVYRIKYGTEIFEIAEESAAESIRTADLTKSSYHYPILTLCKKAFGFTTLFTMYLLLIALT